MDGTACDAQGDHPRGCGEHYRRRKLEAFHHGSSPRMRGAPDRQSERRRRAGIIPADAGSTVGGSDPKLAILDHPRGCGEHRVGLSRKHRWVGSSPRMRGAQVSGAGVGSGRGIIPADAGSTKWKPERRRPTWDHPRGCGEHLRPLAKCSLRMGSSPRMRGAQPSCRVLMQGGGIIPADAGSTP